MLAVAGFLIAGVCFAVFAWTFEEYVARGAKLPVERFACAFYALAAAFVIWGVVLASGRWDLLPASVLAGDALILVGTWFLVPLALPGQRWAPWLAAALFVALWYLRATWLFPVPYVSSGILIFNIQTPVVLALAAVIVGVWLPASWRVAAQVAWALRDASVVRIYTSIYAAAALSAMLFVGSRRALTAALSFAALVLCFGLLVGSNVVVKLAAQPAKGKRHAKS